ncbi:MAG: hypothetical protein IPL58_14255 [Betaproteobacteria bacterium]|uniref:Uncharacterized protein n=1 Tax=Candidatus Proximibacter danicus TaxID=2954365 RepID=A0A9D7PSX6_9PROT|nr:hypothetical protein [Candidatus Proximibacter danicus]
MPCPRPILVEAGARGPDDLIELTFVEQPLALRRAGRLRVVRQRCAQHVAPAQRGESRNGFIQPGQVFPAWQPEFVEGRVKIAVIDAAGGMQGTALRFV